MNKISKFFFAIFGLISLAGCLETVKSANEGLKGIAANLEAYSKAQKESQKVKHGLSIQETKLFGLFEKFPIDGSKPEPSTNGELWYPRVALIPVTIPSEHASKASWGKPNVDPSEIPGIQIQRQRIYDKPKADENICWTFKALIWHSPTKSEEVPEFVYCASDALKVARVIVQGAPPVSAVDKPWLLRSKTTSGEVNTRGPRQPRYFAPNNFFPDRDSGHIMLTYRVWVMRGILIDMGLNPYTTAEGNRAWVSTEKFTLRDF